MELDWTVDEKAGMQIRSVGRRVAWYVPPKYLVVIKQNSNSVCKMQIKVKQACHYKGQKN